jgi:hypothetical protein
MPDAETLMRQAGHTAQYWLGRAINDIDELLGKGYAEKNPALINAYMQSAGLDQCAMYLRNIGDTIDEGTNRIGDAINDIT